MAGTKVEEIVERWTVDNTEGVKRYGLAKNAISEVRKVMMDLGIDSRSTAGQVLAGAKTIGEAMAFGGIAGAAVAGITLLFRQYTESVEAAKKAAEEKAKELLKFAERVDAAYGAVTRLNDAEKSRARAGMTETVTALTNVEVEIMKLDKEYAELESRYEVLGDRLMPRLQLRRMEEIQSLIAQQEAQREELLGRKSAISAAENQSNALQAVIDVTKKVEEAIKKETDATDKAREARKKLREQIENENIVAEEKWRSSVIKSTAEFVKADALADRRAEVWARERVVRDESEAGRVAQAQRRFEDLQHEFKMEQDLADAKARYAEADRASRERASRERQQFGVEFVRDIDGQIVIGDTARDAFLQNYKQIGGAITGIADAGLDAAQTFAYGTEEEKKATARVWAFKFGQMALEYGLLSAARFLAADPVGGAGYATIAALAAGAAGGSAAFGGGIGGFTTYDVDAARQAEKDGAKPVKPPGSGG